MAFAVGRVLSWGGFLGFLGLFSIFVVKRWLVGVMVRGGACRRGENVMWHDKYGYRHPGKEKTNEIPPLSATAQKKNEKILLFLLTK